MAFEFFILKLVSKPIFSLNWQLQFFGPNFPKKGSYFQTKTNKTDNNVDFCLFELLLVLKN